MLGIVVYGLNDVLKTLDYGEGTSAYVCLVTAIRLALCARSSRGLAPHVVGTVVPVARGQTLKPRLWLAWKDGSHTTGKNCA